MREHLLSWGYRCVRRSAIGMAGLYQKIKHQPEDLEDVIVWGDAQLKFWNKYCGPILHDFPIPQGLNTSLYDITFPSPLIISSFKDDKEILNIWLKMGAGGVIFKTVLHEPWAGNARPRILEVQVQGQKALLNAMGLPGPGVQALVAELKKEEKNMVPFRPLGISLGGRSLQEFQDNFAYVHEHLHLSDQRPWYYEINISCPNTKEGQDLSKDLALLQTLLLGMRQKTTRVIGVKLSPDQKDEQVLRYARAVAEFPRTYINIGNTQYRSCTSLGLKEQALTRGGGGLSGKPLTARTLAMVDLLAPIGIPLIATGGMGTAEDVCQALQRGATLVAMATAVVQDSYVLPKINKRLFILKYNNKY